MGNLYIPLASAIRSLGGEVIIPPYNCKKTLSLGTRNSAEAVCLPYKLILGNYIQAIEMGADAILMIDSPGICRLGQYSSSSRMALVDLNYDVEFINFDLYKGKLKEIYNGFKRATGNGNPFDLIKSINLALIKIDILDKLDHAAAYYRPREINEGSTNINYNKGIREIEQAMSAAECKNAINKALKLLSSVPIDKDKDVVHIDITGEIYVVLDYFSNLEIEKELGRLGVHVHRKLNLSDWTKSFLWPSFLRFAETHGEMAERHAKRYLRRDIGGDALESIGDAAIAGNNNHDGVVHLLPFTCMPEIMSQNIMPNVRNETDIPVLSLVLDEQMGKAGYVTRLEAFVDLIKRRKRRNNDSLIKVAS